MLLEAAEEDRQAGAAADGHDLRAARLVAVAVDGIDDVLILRRVDERRQQGCVQLPDREEDDAAGHEQEHGSTYEARKELQRDVVDPVREGVTGVDLTQNVAKTESHDRHADKHERQPALDVHTQVEPFDEARTAEGFHGLANYRTSFPKSSNENAV